MPDFTSRNDRWFFSGMATLLATVIFAGFTPTFFARAAALPPLSVAQWLHGLAGTAWLTLFVLQAWLIVASRRQWHRRLGALGAAFAVAFGLGGLGVIAGVEGSHVYDSPGTFAAHAYANGAPTVAFVVLVALGIWQRGRAAAHKRLMLLAAIALLPPGTGRLFGHLGISFLNLPTYYGVMCVPALYDLAVWRRLHAVSVAGAIALAAVEFSTDEWLAAIDQ